MQLGNTNYCQNNFKMDCGAKAIYKSQESEHVKPFIELCMGKIKGKGVLQMS